MESLDGRRAAERSKADPLKTEMARSLGPTFTLDFDNIRLPPFTRLDVMPTGDLAGGDFF
jgi:hypothetical protein